MGTALVAPGRPEVGGSEDMAGGGATPTPIMVPRSGSLGLMLDFGTGPNAPTDDPDPWPADAGARCPCELDEAQLPRTWACLSDPGTTGAGRGDGL